MTKRIIHSQVYCSFGISDVDGSKVMTTLQSESLQHNKPPSPPPHTTELEL